MFIVHFKLLHFRVVCYIAVDNPKLNALDSAWHIVGAQ